MADPGRLSFQPVSRPNFPGPANIPYGPGSTIPTSAAVQSGQMNGSSSGPISQPPPPPPMYAAAGATQQPVAFAQRPPGLLKPMSGTHMPQSTTYPPVAVAPFPAGASSSSGPHHPVQPVVPSHLGVGVFGFQSQGYPNAAHPQMPPQRSYAGTVAPSRPPLNIPPPSAQSSTVVNGPVTHITPSAVRETPSFSNVSKGQETYLPNGLPSAMPRTLETQPLRPSFAAGPPPFARPGAHSSLPLPGNDSGWSPSSDFITPSPAASEPPSLKSSRNPSPVPSQQYDAMEGQFSPYETTSPSQHIQPGLSSTSPAIPSVPPHSSMTAPRSQPPSMPAGNFNAGGAGPQSTPPLSQPVYQSGVAGRRQYPQQTPLYQPPPTMQASIQQSNQQHMGMPVQSPSIVPSALTPNAMNSASPVSGYGINQLGKQMSGLNLTHGNEIIDLLQTRNILPTGKVEPPRIALPSFDYKQVNCNPDIFRCTLTKIPESSSVLQKSRLPLGILIHPFKDLANLPVIQCNTIVRCRSCRTYINPFVYFPDQRKWKCNLCYRVNELPEEFLYDPVSKSFGDPSRRPEIKSATIEFIAPSEYMLRPPQPAVYLFVLDVSYNAVETGYLRTFCETLQEELSRMPGDARMQIGFITFDSSVHFYSLADGLSQPHMIVVSDIDDIFLPCPDNLLVNLQESKELVLDLLQQLPINFAENRIPDSALGSALQAAFKLMSGIGGRITVVQTCLPNVGPGALKPREDPNQRAAKEVHNLGPANDFYKKLSLDCSGQQIAVDLFILSSQYSDVATLSCISKFSAGSINYYPGYHSQLNHSQAERFEKDLRRYLTRKIGFEAVMRIRCTRGLAIHTFHGNFFVRSTDLLSLPNINPDAGFAMQMSIEETLNESNTACFQAALLYTSSKGERRIRVHTMCLPVCANVIDVIFGADQQAIASLLVKMAADRSVTSSLSDARDALLNACVDSLAAFKATQPSGGMGLLAPFNLRLLPLYILAILKHLAFRLGTSTKLDERVYSMGQMKSLPLSYLMLYIYPNLYPVYNLDDKNCIMHEDVAVPQPPILHLSSEKVDSYGAYLLDVGDNIMIYVCSKISDHFCQNVLNVSSYASIPDSMVELPELETPDSVRLRNFVNYLQSQRPFHASFHVIKYDGKLKYMFLQHMIEDRTESTYSFHEFLQHLKEQITK